MLPPGLIITPLSRAATAALTPDSEPADAYHLARAVGGHSRYQEAQDAYTVCRGRHVVLRDAEQAARRALIVEYSEISNPLSIAYFNLYLARAEARASKARLTCLLIELIGCFVDVTVDGYSADNLVDAMRDSHPARSADQPLTVTRSALSRAAGFPEDAMSVMVAILGVVPEDRARIRSMSAGLFFEDPGNLDLAYSPRAGARRAHEMIAGNLIKAPEATVHFTITAIREGGYAVRCREATCITRSGDVEGLVHRADDGLRLATFYRDQSEERHISLTGDIVSSPSPLFTYHKGQL